MANIGYARVSSEEQKLDTQLDKLKDCYRIFEEKGSGIDDQRPQLQECLRYLREGDTLFITKIDRLARSTLHLCQIVEKLQKKKVDLVVLDQNIDTSTSSGRLLLNMLGVIAQFETEIRAERQRDGIRKAKEKGIRFGKPFKLTNDQVKEMWEKREKGFKIKDLMQEYGLSKATIYIYLAKAKNKITPESSAERV